MLSLDFGKQLEGYRDSLPIVLADVHLADGDYPEITAEEFELALSVMVLTKNPPKSLGQWYKVLDVARRWQSQHLRDTAIAHIAKSDLHASMRLMISTKYDIPEWLPDILLDLCLQSSFPSDDMAHLPPSLIPPLLFGTRRIPQPPCFQGDKTSHVSQLLRLVCHQPRTVTCLSESVVIAYPGPTKTKSFVPHGGVSRAPMQPCQLLRLHSPLEGNLGGL
ncbi:hypothetical protein BS47DRAFT_1134296 [Hydnum rufescens UP504]|uniref:Uncharacterized protein n=1 Tax=Hydnum rufescens UP504 TaxID=1448309 RepID=A0A9P6DUN7_9AGAM|nr:hypothetical protein BS47DRAFT_1134296 [Hydnum rufescens UP504]